MDERFNSSLKFHHVTSAKRLGFASTGALLTPWSLQLPAPSLDTMGCALPLRLMSTPFSCWRPSPRYSLQEREILE